MQDEAAKDNGQTAAGISHDLIRNKELALSSMRNLQSSLCISLKKLFLPQTNTSHLIPSVQKPNYQIDRTVQARVMGKGFSATKKYRSKTTNHSQVA